MSGRPRRAAPAWARLDGVTRDLLLLALAAFACYLVTRLGLAVSAPGRLETPVWPASGVALALVLLAGLRTWPAVAVGALAALLQVGVPVAPAAGVTAGTAVEAVLAWWLLARVRPVAPAIGSLRDTVWLLVLGSKAAPLAGSLVVVLSLTAGGLLPWDRFGINWLVVWAGRALGVAVVAPFLMAWLARPAPGFARARRAEAVLVAVLLTAAATLVFAAPMRLDAIYPKWSYLVFPVALWAAGRFDMRGAATATLIVAVIAIIGTAAGRGPFTGLPPVGNLLSLQAYLATLALSSLVLGASVMEREQAKAEAEAARERAEAANRSKSLFLASASHDLRQPLNAISLLLGLQMARSPGDVTLARMRASLDALVTMFNNLLDVSKLDTGMVETNRRAIPAQAMLDLVDRDYSAVAEAKGLTLRVVGSSRHVESDPVLLERILRNLVANAVEHTVAGRVLVGCRPRGDVVRFEVQDTGPGIAAEHAGRIFDLLYQVDNPERRSARGHGLGLAIVKRAADVLGHRLGLWSVPGRGSCFWVEVPQAAPPAPAVPRRPAPVAATAARHGPVLVIEDDPAAREALTLVLHDFGCTVVTAADAAEALARLDPRVPPQLVIADLRLPGGIDGIEAVRRIRERAGDVPACIISGEIGDEVRDRAVAEVGCFLRKPVAAGTLAEMVSCRAAPAPS